MPKQPETKIFNQDGKVIINVPALAVAFTTAEAFKLMKLFKKHIKEADLYNRQKEKEKKNERKNRNPRKNETNAN